MTEVRLDAPTKFKVIRSDDGRLHCEGAFCRDGILEYRQPNGEIIRELRRPEINSDPQTVESFKFLPLGIEHPKTGLLNTKTYKEYAVGTTDSSSVHYDSEFGGIVGWVSLFDENAIKLAESKEKVELSAGYTCDIKQEKGVWNGQAYDREQINVRANHLALTSKGRAGEDVKLRLDSEAGIGVAMSSLSTHKNRMAVVRCDDVEYSDIPEVFASIAGAKFKELDEQVKRVDSLTDKLENLTTQLKSTEENLSKKEGRLDALETVLSNAELVLSELGFFRDSEGIYHRTDAKAKKKVVEMTEEDDEDLDEMEGEVEEEDHLFKKKQKKKDGKCENCAKNDSEDDEDEFRQDSTSDLLEAWREADLVVPNFSSERFDSGFSVADIRRSVLAEIEPNLDLSIRSDAYVEGVYYQAIQQLSRQEPEEREDSEEEPQENYVNQLETLLKTGKRTDSCEEMTDWEKQKASNYKKPLTMSKTKMSGGMMK